MFALIAIGAGTILYATLGRIVGIHRPLGWVSGGNISLTGELCIGVFVLSMGLAVWTESGAWIIPALAAWVAGFVSQRRAQRRHAAAEKQLRVTNSARYPGVFDKAPPTDLDATNDETFDLFDAGACTYLGQVSRRDLESLIARHRDVPEQDPNDLFMLRESLGLFPAGELSDELVTLLNKAFDERDCLELRWMPPTRR